PRTEFLLLLQYHLTCHLLIRPAATCTVPRTPIISRQPPPRGSFLLGSHVSTGQSRSTAINAAGHRSTAVNAAGHRSTAVNAAGHRSTAADHG
nr:hypothetical protein [Tanacetum cinerariifolium]